MAKKQVGVRFLVGRPSVLSSTYKMRSFKEKITMSTSLPSFFALSSLTNITNAILYHIVNVHCLQKETYLLTYLDNCNVEWSYLKPIDCCSRIAPGRIVFTNIIP